MPEHSERKLATVLFADLAGSTARADDQDPERTRARLERFYDAMAEEIQAAGGTVEKFAGDAVMAAFGVPEALEDHAERALHTALAMQRRLHEGLSLRIGVNTGEVVAGVAREGSSFVSGDTVNVAARLEQAAEPGEILVGERTAAAARGAFELGDPRVVEAKGKPGGVSCRPLLRALSLMRARGVGGLARAFVGRDEELGRLRAAFDRAVEGGRPVLVTVVGDAGVGKTRLMRELWEELAGAQPHAMLRTGRCLAYGKGITYWPFAEILKEHLGIFENHSPEDVRRALSAREILGLTLGLDVAGDLHPLAARDRLQSAWVELMSELAQDGPVVLLIEDVHWAEQPLLDLVERLGRDVEGPLLLIATARTDFVETRSAWAGRVDTETISLEPLPVDSAATLVDSLLGGDFPPTVRALVVERSEGNPFFVEEVLGGLIDAGLLERTNGAWHAKELPPGFEIPDSVQAVLAARIDLLTQADKAALQAAAVIGRVFWTGPVYELVGSDLEPDLHLLENRDLIRRRSGSSLEGEVEYVFKHALTREVAYGTLTKARRARLHARFGEWIERIGAGREEHAPLLAHHYAEAVRPEDVDVAWPDGGGELEELQARAGHWLTRAGDAAVSRYEIDDAIALFRRAIALEPTPSQRGLLWRRIGRANALKYDGDAFMQAMTAALEVTDDPEERAETYAELCFEGALRGGMWKDPVDQEVMAAWTSEALAGVRHGSEAHVKTLIARVFWGVESEEDATLASRLAETLGNPALRSAAWDAKGMAAFRAGDVATSHTWETRRFDLIPELKNPDDQHDVYLSTIAVSGAVGRIREARRLAESLDELVTELTPHHRVHGIACKLEVEELAGNWAAIAALEPEAERRIGDNLDTPCVRNARSLLVAALAREVLGDNERARELEAQSKEIGNEGDFPAVALVRTRLALARGELDRLEELLADRSWLKRQTWFALPSAAATLDALAVIADLETVEQTTVLFERPDTYLEPFALRARGLTGEDEALIARANERFAALRLQWHLQQTETLRRLRQLAAV